MNRVDEKRCVGVDNQHDAIRAGAWVIVKGRVIDFQTEPCDYGEPKPLTRVLIEFTEIECDEPRGD